MFYFQASKSRPAKEPIREKIEEEETRAADLEAGHEVAVEVEEETDEEEATGRVPTEPSSLSESTTSPPVASKRYLLSFESYRIN